VAGVVVVVVAAVAVASVAVVVVEIVAGSIPADEMVRKRIKVVAL
jgi:hypothetical protein